MGEVAVPTGALWGASTQRTLELGPISGARLHAAVVVAIAEIKRGAAPANQRCGVPGITAAIAEAIVAAADVVITGDAADQFPLDVFQSGSGTSTNMNVNEVVAALASASLGDGGAVHPNDHVNASQSSNDVFPSAIRIAVLGRLEGLLTALGVLEGSLRAKGSELAGVVKAGRTHLMDATPVTLGQELDGYASQLAACRRALEGERPVLGELPLGGTATGTGINAPAGFAAAVIAEVARRTGLELREAPDHFAVQGGQDALAQLSGRLRAVAIALMKVANDVRLMASGPRTGLAEIALPALQPGSSIMPGKVNPVVPEVVTQVAVQVIGNDAAVALACSQGTLELNTYLPVIAQNLLSSIDLLAAACELFAQRCIDGVVADEARARRFAESSPAIATSLVPALGYAAVAEIVGAATAEDRTIREVVLARGLLDAEVLDRLLDVDRMAGGSADQAG